MAVAPSLLTLGLNASTFMAHRRVSWLERAWMRHLARRGLSRRRIARGFGRSEWCVVEHCKGIAARCRLRARSSSDADRRAASADVKAERRSAGRCINGPSSGYVSRRGTVHGEVVRGGKCQRCIDVHAGRAVVA